MEQHKFADNNLLHQLENLKREQPVFLIMLKPKTYCLMPGANLTFSLLYSQGVFCRNLDGHAHWVNNLALSTDYVMRTGAFDPADATIVHEEVTDGGDEHLRIPSF